MSKVAFLTLDAEAFSETMCLHGREVADEAGEGLFALLDLFAKYGAKITLFLTERGLSLWGKQLAARTGLEFAIHARVHEPVLGQSEEEFAAPLRFMREEVRRTLGAEAAGYRAPCFGIDADVIKRLKRCGFCYDSSALNYRNARYGRLDLSGWHKVNDVVYEKDGFFEFKPSVARAPWGKFPVCGGAYLRLPPWAVVKPVLRRHLARSNAFLFYAHPFEVMEKLPLPGGLPYASRLYLTRGRGEFLDRIERTLALLLEEGYEWSSPAEYLRTPDGEARSGPADLMPGPFKSAPRSM